MRIAEAHALRTPAGHEALQRRLSAMERDGQVIPQPPRRFRADRPDGPRHGARHRASGRVRVPPSRRRGRRPVPLPRQMRSLMHGDRAVVRVVRVDRDGRREGALVEVVERGRREGWSGRFRRESGGGVRPPPQFADPPTTSTIPPGADLGAHDGDYVVSRVTEPPTRAPSADRRGRGGARRSDAARNGDRRGHPGLRAAGGVARGG